MSAAPGTLVIGAGDRGAVLCPRTAAGRSFRHGARPRPGGRQGVIRQRGWPGCHRDPACGRPRTDLAGCRAGSPTHSGRYRSGPLTCPGCSPGSCVFSVAARPPKPPASQPALTRLLAPVYDDVLPLLAELGLSGNLHRVGALWIYDTDGGFARDAAAHATRRRHGIEVEEISAGGSKTAGACARHDDRAGGDDTAMVACLRSEADRRRPAAAPEGTGRPYQAVRCERHRG